MKPALFNEKHKQSSVGLPDLLRFYSNQIRKLYVNLLKESGVKNLDEKITVSTKFPDGHVMEQKYKAGHHFIMYLFDSQDLAEDIKKLDEHFLANCPCEDKEEVLIHLKHMLTECGSESISEEDWKECLKDFKTCEYAY
jgi:hypothetical protein